MKGVIPITIISIIAITAILFFSMNVKVTEENDTTVDDAFVEDLNNLLEDIDSINETDYELSDLEISEEIGISFD